MWHNQVTTANSLAAHAFWQDMVNSTNGAMEWLPSGRSATMTMATPTAASSTTGVDNKSVGFMSQLATVPNLLSVGRMIAVYGVIALYWYGFHATAVVMGFVVGITDLLDG